jgi:hypothetical protein
LVFLVYRQTFLIVGTLNQRSVSRKWLRYQITVVVHLPFQGYVMNNTWERELESYQEYHL